MNEEAAEERVAAAPPERLFTSVLMAIVALAANAVRPSHEEIRGYIERSKEPYFRSFLSRCINRVYHL